MVGTGQLSAHLLRHRETAKNPPLPLCRLTDLPQRSCLPWLITSPMMRPDWPPRPWPPVLDTLMMLPAQVAGRRAGSFAPTKQILGQRTCLRPANGNHRTRTRGVLPARQVDAQAWAHACARNCCAVCPGSWQRRHAGHRRVAATPACSAQSGMPLRSWWGLRLTDCAANWAPGTRHLLSRPSGSALLAQVDVRR